MKNLGPMSYSFFRSEPTYNSSGRRNIVEYLHVSGVQVRVPPKNGTQIARS